MRDLFQLSEVRPERIALVKDLLQLIDSMVDVYRLDQLLEILDHDILAFTHLASNRIDECGRIQQVHVVGWQVAVKEFEVGMHKEP